MNLSKEAIEEYKQIYKKEFGEEISDQEAYEQGSRLIRLLETLYKIEHRNKGEAKPENEKNI